MKNLYKVLVVLFVSGFTNYSIAQNFPCPNGLDVHIANDVSGSIDGREFNQAKNFVAQLAASFGNTFGTANDQSRVSISNWSSIIGGGDFIEYDFPIAGENYTTNLSDILSYSTSVRPFAGETNVYTALLRANDWVEQNPVAGRTAPKVIVLLTDTSCEQVANNVEQLATRIKDRGVYIVVLAIDDAVGCDRLAKPTQQDKVASPGGYFEAQDYQTLQDDAITFIQNITSASCTNPPTPKPFDLTITINSFILDNCDNTPTASLNYTVTNTSGGQDFNANLRVSFYNGDPTDPSTQYLFTHNAGLQNIPLFNGTYDANNIVDFSLFSAGEIFALVNFDGGVPGNEVPLVFSNLENQIHIPGEFDATNNVSIARQRVDTGTCLPYAILNTNVRNTGQVCDNEVIYYVEVCNTGTADGEIDNIEIFAPLDFSLVGGPTLVGDNPLTGSAGNILPISECVVYEYIYNLDNATPNTAYDLSVNIEDFPCDNDVSTGSGAIVQMMYNYTGVYNLNNYNWCAREITQAMEDAAHPSDPAPLSGKVWLDRNLGAYDVATTFDDISAYGDLYQWGRRMDGHAKRYQSNNDPFEGSGPSDEGLMVNGVSNSRTDNPTDNLFILSQEIILYDWRLNPDDGLWNGTSSTNNNPCPAGYRIPNISELNALRTWLSGNRNLKAIDGTELNLPSAGQRSGTTGDLIGLGDGYYYSSSTASQFARGLQISNSFGQNIIRVNGVSVRCLRD